MSERCIFKVRKFHLDSVRRLRKNVTQKNDTRLSKLVFKALFSGGISVSDSVVSLLGTLGFNKSFNVLDEHLLILRSWYYVIKNIVM